jgi:hypothetical protein
MTGDESWFDSNYDSTTIFARAPDEVVPRLSPTIGSKKVMVAIFFTASRLLKPASVPQGQKYHKGYFNNEIFESVNQDCNQSTGYRVTNTMKIDMDHGPRQNDLETLQAIG